MPRGREAQKERVRRERSAGVRAGAFLGGGAARTPPIQPA